MHAIQQLRYDIENREQQNQLYLRIRIGTRSFGYAPIHLYAPRHGTFS